MLSSENGLAHRTSPDLPRINNRCVQGSTKIQRKSRHGPCPPGVCSLVLETGPFYRRYVAFSRLPVFYTIASHTGQPLLRTGGPQSSEQGEILVERTFQPGLKEWAECHKRKKGISRVGSRAMGDPQRGFLEGNSHSIAEGSLWPGVGPTHILNGSHLTG